MAELPGRVVVGVSGSLGSLAALRRAVDEARRSQRLLLPLLAWTPPGGEGSYRRAPCPQLAKVWEDTAVERLLTAFEEGLGGRPTDLPVQPMVVRAEAGYALCDVADRPADLLVVGTGRRGALTRLAHAGVSRYVLAHAVCPVLAVPPPRLPHGAARALRRLDPADFGGRAQALAGPVEGRGGRLPAVGRDRRPAPESERRRGSDAG
ncbi:universal stress protein [Streptacidiphilus sp. P02-A3a]|uniref:universal stress protein n=1 Tax=Streptacidiphilus sp. P02-A3a TaxID=2704468 RepID=UPI001CDCB1E7|nr:universal stress protein [Streptacidiphilus sp. P02-A3a]